MSPYTVDDVVLTKWGAVAKIIQVLTWKWRGSWQYMTEDLDTHRMWLISATDIERPV
jgi:hypothetical protein